MSNLESDVAKVAKQAGADAVILVSSDTETTGSTGYIPDDWGAATMRPVQKQNSKYAAKRYAVETAPPPPNQVLVATHRRLIHLQFIVPNAFSRDIRLGFVMKSVSEKDLAMLIAVAMAADGRHAPTLRGKNSPVDPVERDRVRSEFAEWVAKLLMSSNLVILQKPPSTHGPFPGTRALGTPPQMRSL